MRIKGYDINSKSIASYVRGNMTKFLIDNNIKQLQNHEQEQVKLRMLLCKECVENEECVICHCKTPNLFFDFNKIDSKGRWGKLLNKSQWEDFMGKTIKKNSKLKDTESKSQATKPSAKKLEKLAEAYTKYYLEDDRDMIYSIEFEDNNYDLGEVVLNSTTNISYKIKNNLSFDIQISKILAGCGCTSASWPAEIIRPNEEFTVFVAFEARSIGKVRKNLSIIYTDNRIISTTLMISGTVILHNLIPDYKPDIELANASTDDVSRPGLSDNVHYIKIDKEYFLGENDSLNVNNSTS